MAKYMLEIKQTLEKKYTEEEAIITESTNNDKDDVIENKEILNKILLINTDNNLELPFERTITNKIKGEKHKRKYGNEMVDTNNYLKTTLTLSEITDDEYENTQDETDY